MDGSRLRPVLATIAGAVSLWVLGFGISLGRLIVNPASDVRQLLWAEDGLFPLCVRKVGVVDCFLDPFAGYLVGVPRLIAGLVAIFPMDSWALAANLTAAILWGVFVPLLYFGLRDLGIHVIFRLLVALSVVLLPSIGLEAVNVVASIYMPLLFTATVIVLVMGRNRWTLGAAGILGFLAALTIPLAAWLIVLIIARALRRGISWRMSGFTASPIAAGLALQLWVVFTAEQARSLAVTASGLGAWFDAIPNSILHLWPGLNFGAASVYGIFTLPTFALTGALVGISLLVLGVAGMRSRSEDGNFSGAMLVTGLIYSLVPTVTGYASNRYFILSTLCFFAAGIVWLDKRLGRRGLQWPYPVFAAVVLLAWSSAFSASDWRAASNPAWSDQVRVAEDVCGQDPWGNATLRFSPDWPQEGVTELFEPTTNVIPCRLIGSTR